VLTDLVEGQSNKRRNSRHYTRAETDSTSADDKAITDRRSHRRYRSDYLPTSTVGDPRRDPPNSHQNSSSPRHLDPTNVLGEQPLPAMYFEPTFNHEYLQPVAQPSWGGFGLGAVQSRGVQNVPSMSTVGVQYAVDGSRIPVGTRVPYFYHPSSTNHAFSSDPQRAEASMPTAPGVGVQPMVVTGTSCPLCGLRDYHVHSEVNSTNILPGGAPTAADPSTTIPVAVAPAQTPSMARCKHFI